MASIYGAIKAANEKVLHGLGYQILSIFRFCWPGREREMGPWKYSQKKKTENRKTEKKTKQIKVGVGMDESPRQI